MHQNNLPRGALLMLASGLLFAAMGALIKNLSATLPNEMLVFFRSLIGLLVLTPWLLHRGPSYFATRRLGAHLLRALTGLAAMYCFFYALGRLPLAEAVLLNYSAPLFIPSTRESSPARAERRMTGTWRVSSFARSAATRPKPSRRGIMTSLSTRS